MCKLEKEWSCNGLFLISAHLIIMGKIHNHMFFYDTADIW